MYRNFLRVLWTFIFCVCGGCRAVDTRSEDVGKTYVDECRDYPELCAEADGGTDTGEDADGTGGSAEGMPYLTLPFPSGEYWQVTQTYNPSNDTASSHYDYGGTYSDDRWAVDFAQSGCEDYGKPVNPMADGTVYLTVEDDGSGTDYGNTVIVRHSNSFYSRYAHMSEILVSEGDSVDTNDYIGKVGNTGYVVGSDCPEHLGTHLHIAVYKDGEGIKPEPLSGNSGLTELCWYNRDGDVSCSGNPGDYEGEENEDEGEISISYLAANPEEGTAGETEFVWTTVINSPDLDPEATLVIHNPNDGINYDFTMETDSAENPWTFVYQKTLRDAATYTYWVEAGNGDGNAVSDIRELTVDEAVDSGLNVNSITWSPLEGTADETEFTWNVSVTSSSKPSVTLYILNPNDGVTYDFAMSTSGSGSSWTSTYSKTLRDPTTYAFWAVAGNGVTTSVSAVGSLTVSDASVEGSGGGGDTGSTDTGEIVVVDTGTVDTGSVDTDTGEVKVDTGTPADTGGGTDTGSSSSTSCNVTVPTDYATIQDAIDSVGSNDVICVESGTYNENLSLSGTNVTLVSLDGAGSTIIDGSGSGNVISISGGSSATVEGFTVQDGNSWPGGGIYIYGSSPTIKHCVVTGNLPYGISITDYAEPVIENVLSVSNDYRGFYVANYSNPTIVNSVVAGNVHDGIGIFSFSTVYMTNSIVYGNGDYGVDYGSASSSAVTDYNDLYGNGLGEYYGGASASSTDFSSDPGFAETTTYTLSSGSVCADAGNPSSSYYDADGSRNDLGAYGGPLGSW